MNFTKMHGLGNDYIFLYCPQGEPEGAGELSRHLSDRHTGVGGDGLICICPSRRADFRMAMFNADGSRGSMCGNGIRCLGKYVYDRGHTRKTILSVETDGGIRTLVLQVEGNTATGATVDMGAPRVGRKMELEVEGRRITGTPVWMGNPHLVCPVEDVGVVDVEALGPRLERHPRLSQRVNVEFVALRGEGRVAMRVWERGSGETMACGTGASAAVAALASAGRVGRQAVVELPGGELTIRWAQDGHIYMTGPAVTVFDGQLAH